MLVVAVDVQQERGVGAAHVVLVAAPSALLPLTRPSEPMTRTLSPMSPALGRLSDTSFASNVSMVPVSVSQRRPIPPVSSTSSDAPVATSIRIRLRCRVRHRAPHASWARRVLLRLRYGDHHDRGQRQGGGRRFGAGALNGAGAAGLVGGALLNEAFDDEPEVVVNNDYEDEPQTPDGARSSLLRTAGCPGAAGCRRVGAYTGCPDVRWV
ncbi:hypothetical protein ACFXGR_39805 [Streptomyces mirabilis]|uniref:hypothetical protein n=1 Tax=Streptomyces mirabilis TaxID=68239 RepID=UPI0036940CF8